MIKLLLICTVLALTACASQPVPVTIKFPDAPKDLLYTCPDLIKLDAEKTTELSQILENVTKNYGQYYDCKTKVDNWNEWYNSQKKIFDTIK